MLRKSVPALSSDHPSNRVSSFSVSVALCWILFQPRRPKQVSDSFMYLCPLRDFSLELYEYLSTYGKICFRQASKQGLQVEGRF